MWHNGEMVDYLSFSELLFAFCNTLEDSDLFLAFPPAFCTLCQQTRVPNSWQREDETPFIDLPQITSCAVSDQAILVQTKQNDILRRRARRCAKDRHSEIRCRICQEASVVDLDELRTELMLSKFIGDGDGKPSRDGISAGEVRERAGVVGKGVRGENVLERGKLFRVDCDGVEVECFLNVFLCRCDGAVVCCDRVGDGG